MKSTVDCWRPSSTENRNSLAVGQLDHNPVQCASYPLLSHVIHPVLIWCFIAALSIMLQSQTSHQSPLCPCPSLLMESVILSVKENELACRTDFS